LDEVDKETLEAGHKVDEAIGDDSDWRPPPHAASGRLSDIHFGGTLDASLPGIDAYGGVDVPVGGRPSLVLNAAKRTVVQLAPIEGKQDAPFDPLEKRALPPRHSELRVDTSAAP